MIPIIGVMLGLYIMTQCMAVADTPRYSTLVKVLATITFVANMFGVIALTYLGLR